MEQFDAWFEKEYGKVDFSTGALKNAFKEIARKAWFASRWIPCSEILPTPSDTVMTYTTEIQGCKHRLISADLKGRLPSSVTHWVPLPEPPTEKGME